MSAAHDEFRELMRDKDRRTAHPEDDTDGRSFLNLSDDEDDRHSYTPTNIDPDTEAPLRNMGNSRNFIPSRRYEANTGPKGVISDAQDFRDSQRIQRRSMQQSRSKTRSSSRNASPALQELGEEDGLDDDDDDFMQNWREGRLRELQNRPRDSKLHSRGHGRRLYGGLSTVDGDGYLDAVDNSGPHTMVVVYIYDDFSHVSDLFESCIRTLAGKHQSTRFVKFHYADAEMEPAGVPAIIAYRGGDKFAALVPVLNEIPDDADLTALTLEMVLKRHSILE